ncbi:MAG: methyltransferase domain-containing protein [Elusimicrobia bacterium]|nr:methyltransferase domain-containing protein [Elusimicrobiota bacterium]
MKRLPKVRLAAASVFFAGVVACLAAQNGVPRPDLGGREVLGVSGKKQSRRSSRRAEISHKIASSQAVLAYLRHPGAKTLKAALETCLSARKRIIPDDALIGFFTAFCYHEMGDSAREENALSKYSPAVKNTYRFIFYEHRDELAEALYFFPPVLCRRLREEPDSGNFFPPGSKCPSSGGPISGEKYRSGNRVINRFICPKCDAALGLRENRFLGDSLLYLFKKKGNPLPPVFLHYALSARRFISDKSDGGPEEFLALFGVREGQVIADIGCGSGYLTFPFAEKVGAKGRVYAEDIDEGAIKLIKYCAEKGGIKNIEPVLGGPDDIKIPPGTLDMAVFFHVYRDMLVDMDDKGPEYADSFFNRFFAGVHKALKKDGVFIIAGRIEPAFGLSVEKVVAELKKRNFRLISDKSDSPYFRLFFKKSEQRRGNEGGR